MNPKVKKIFIVGFVAVLISALPLFAAQHQDVQQKLAALEKMNGKFTFAVIGDNRSGHEVYAKLVNMIVERKPAFVMNTGDVITTPGSKEDWDRFWEMSKPITVGYFIAVGNHDAHPKVPFSEKVYKQQVELPGNELYYSFNAGNALFVVLDSFIDDQEKKITGEQYQWLEKTLSSSDKKHKFVFMHHPMYTQPGKGSHAGDSLDKYPADRDKLEALLVKAHVDAVFTGHDHLYQKMMVDNFPHVITGGGGAPLYGKDEDGAFNHFIMVTVDGDKVGAEVIDGSGNVRDRF
jgi:hypothetical protein